LGVARAAEEPEVDIKNLILIGGGLLIAAVVAHGLWIAWRARRDPLRLKIDEKLIAAVAERDPVQADFPNGGARVVARWDEPVHQTDLDLESGMVPAGTAGMVPAGTGAMVPADREMAERRTAGRTPADRAPRVSARVEPRAAPSATPGTLPDNETVAEASMRQAAAEQGGTRDDGVQTVVVEAAPLRAAVEPEGAGAEGRLDALRSEIRVGEASAARPGKSAAPRGGEGGSAKGSETAAGPGGSEGLRAGVARRAQEAFKALGNRPAPRQGAVGGSRAAGAAPAGTQAQSAGSAHDAAPEDLILINVLAPREQPFTGDKLVDALRANGLRYGDMNIFHRIDAQTRVHQFSVANIIEPGTFDMAEVEEIRSPGLCFFMRLPGPDNPVEAFEDMQHVARDVAQRLGGELKDERRSVLTGQTVEHYRHRVAEFCRRRMSMRA